MARNSVSQHHVRLAADTAAYQKGMAAAAASTDRLTNSQRRGASASRNMGFRAQQAGFQVQDFFVQVGAGQSAMRAFTQQAPQFLGVFGPGGAIAGAALAIAAVSAQLIGAGSEAQATGEKIGSLREELERFIKAREEARFGELTLLGKKEDLQRQLDNAKRAVEELIDYSNDYQMRRRREQLARDLAAPGVLSTDDSSQRMIAEIARIDEHLGKNEETLARIRNLQTEQIALQQKLKDVTKELGEETERSAEKRAKEMNQSIAEAVDNMEALKKEGATLSASVASPFEKHEASIARWQFLMDSNVITLETYNRLVEQADDSLEKFLDAERLDNMGRAAKDMARQMDLMWNSVSDRAGQALADMLLRGENTFDQLADIVARSMLEIVSRMAIINPLLNAVFGGFSGFNLLPTFGIFGGGGPVSGRSAAGPVVAGQTYRWQEANREYFIPGMDGKVVSASDAGGGTTVYIDATGADRAAISRLWDALQSVNASIEERSVAANLERRLRGGTFARV